MTTTYSSLHSRSVSVQNIIPEQIAKVLNDNQKILYYSNSPNLTVSYLYLSAYILQNREARFTPDSPTEGTLKNFFGKDIIELLKPGWSNRSSFSISLVPNEIPSEASMTFIYKPFGNNPMYIGQNNLTVGGDSDLVIIEQGQDLLKEFVSSITGKRSWRVSFLWVNDSFYVVSWDKDGGKIIFDPSSHKSELVSRLREGFISFKLSGQINSDTLRYNQIFLGDEYVNISILSSLYQINKAGLKDDIGKLPKIYWLESEEIFVQKCGQLGIESPENIIGNLDIQFIEFTQDLSIYEFQAMVQSLYPILPKSSVVVIPQLFDLIKSEYLSFDSTFRDEEEYYEYLLEKFSEEIKVKYSSSKLNEFIRLNLEDFIEPDTDPEDIRAYKKHLIEKFEERKIDETLRLERKVRELVEDRTKNLKFRLSNKYFGEYTSTSLQRMKELLEFTRFLSNKHEIITIYRLPGLYFLDFQKLNQKKIDTLQEITRETSKVDLLDTDKRFHLLTEHFIIDLLEELNQNLSLPWTVTFQKEFQNSVFSFQTSPKMYGWQMLSWVPDVLINHLNRVM